VADVQRRHREQAVAVIDGEPTRCGLAFIEQKPELCTCEGRGYCYRVRYPRAAEAVANAEAKGALDQYWRGREDERRAIVKRAHELSYGPTLRRFIRDVVREYHLSGEAEHG
jgi:hypothetical protein